MCSSSGKFYVKQTQTSLKQHLWWSWHEEICIFLKKNYTNLLLFLKCRFSFRNDMFSVLSDIYKEAFEHYKGTEEKKFNSKFGSLLHDLHQSLEQPVLSGGSSYGSTSCRCPPPPPHFHFSILWWRPPLAKKPLKPCNLCCFHPVQVSCNWLRWCICPRYLSW